MSMEPTSRPRVPMVPGPKETQPRPPAQVAMQDGRALMVDVPRPGPVGKIARAIAGVMRQVGTIPKNGYNKFHGYHYATAGDLFHALTPLMGEQGLALLQNEISINPIENTRVAVTYEFTLIHESNETWQFRQSGMALARDSKGNWDDKALNKCHTAARKYALMSLFQVPSGDFDDADAGDTAQPAEQQRPVPGPKQPPAETKPAPSEEGTPHKINLGAGAGADQWANAYIRNIGKAKTEADVTEFDKLNDATLQMLSDRYSQIYEMISAAVQRRLQDLSGTPLGMPDPKADTQEAMNWIANQLQSFNEYKTAETFWNQVVAPREKEFDQVDWEMLMDEWKRAENRLAPQATDDGAGGTGF